MRIKGTVWVSGGVDVHDGVLLRSCEGRVVVLSGRTSINSVTSTEGDVTIE
jgi:hypothetical protein